MKNLNPSAALGKTAEPGKTAAPRKIAALAAIAFFALAAASTSAFAEIAPVTPSRPASGWALGWWPQRFAEKAKLIKERGAFDVVFVGDSITHYFESTGKVIWEPNFGSKGKFPALDLGFSGDRTEHVLWRLDHGELDGYTAKWFVVMIGTNNVGHGGPAGKSPQDVVMGVRGILDRILAKHPESKILLHPIFPRGEKPDNAMRRFNDVVNGGIECFADEEKIFWCDFNAKLLAADGTLTKDIMPDLLHPNAKGYGIWAEAILPFFEGKAEPRKLDKWAWCKVPTTGAVSRNMDDWWRDKFLRNRKRISECGGEIEFVMLGDSITHYWEIGEGLDTSKDILELEKLCTTMNCGYGGAHIQSLRWRVLNGELDGYKAKVISLMIGTNNGEKQEEVAEGIRTLLGDIRAKQPGAVILLHSILPCNTGLSPRVAWINDKLRSFCDGKKVRYVDFAKDCATADGKLIDDMFYDQLHLSDKGLHRWFEILKPLLADLLAKPRRVDVPANVFAANGWGLDVQFMDEMGSAYLIAHGLGSPVRDAVAKVRLDTPGVWRVWARTRKWVEGAGRFQVLVNGKPLEKTFGDGKDVWAWEDGGTVNLASGEVKLALRDLDGFDGRCAGLVLTRGEIPAPDGALSITNLPAAREYDHDFVVVGGGLAGCCAAVAAARRGLKVALVQDRPVAGGNASGEIRVWCAGEIRYPLVRELRNQFMNMRYENATSDEDRMRFLEREPNLDCFFNHRAFGVVMRHGQNGKEIGKVTAFDVKGNRVVNFRAPLFCDATGDGWIGYYAGADYRYGREGKEESGERMAPEKGDRMTLGSSIMWESHEGTWDIPFSAPWAEPYACGLVRTGGDWNWEFGLKEDLFTSGEKVRDRVLLAIYGAFSNAKKLPQNVHMKLVTCPYVLGKRETRRLLGDVIFSSEDVINHTPWPDAVATGSWSVDLHYTIDEKKIPFLTRCEQPHYGRYYLPYRSLYSRNVPNLFMAGRCFSCTHAGLGSPRVMNTLGQLGVAVGEAAAMCFEGCYSPRGLYEGGHAKELQDRLGGEFPGRPDPTKAGWKFIDDEDPSVKFEGKWELGWNCNGGQLGNRSHYSCDKAAKAVYPLPVEKKGRYRLKAIVPHLFNQSISPIMDITITSAGVTKTFEWHEFPESGFWRDLGEFELEPGATLTIAPSPKTQIVENKWTPPFYTDGFAVVPVAE